MWNKLLLGSLALGFLLSCGGKGEAPEAAIAFSQNPFLVECDAAEVDCGLICNTAWTASSKDVWITVLTPEGASGDPLRVRLAANNAEAERNGSITVRAGSAGKVLQLIQDGNSASNFVSDRTPSLDTYGTAIYLSVNTEDEWTWTTPEDAPWLLLEKKGPAALGISAEVNYSGSPRSAAFTVRTTDGSKQAQVTVTQQFSNEKFLASTEFGRRLVYATGSFIKSVSADTYRLLTDGVESLEMSCRIKDNLAGETTDRQRIFFLFKVDMTKATVLATLPDDDDDKFNAHPEVYAVQKMTRQLSALQSGRSGLTVWGGVNGDYFFGNTASGTEAVTNALQGVLYRGGECLKSDSYQTTNTVFAVFKDGTARCMGQTDYNDVKSRIQEAIGGRQRLLIGGSSMEFTTASQKEQQPRTAVGTSADGKTVFLLVVDGRQGTYSTGSYSVSYEVLAKILKGAGAADAINLDGGGSSTFVVRETNGTLSRHNKPSNPNLAEREVADGLAVVTYN